VVRENLSVLVIGSFVVSYLSKCPHITFFAIWFRACLRVCWIVSDVVIFSYLLGLVLKLLVAEFNYIMFNCYIFV
jgi:hypothetical protein